MAVMRILSTDQLFWHKLLKGCNASLQASVIALALCEVVISILYKLLPLAESFSAHTPGRLIFQASLCAGLEALPAL